MVADTRRTSELTATGVTTDPARPPSDYTGLTETMAGGMFWRGLAAYQIDLSSSPVSATWTDGTASGYYATAIATFEP
jgi:hypothetical protein